MISVFRKATDARYIIFEHEQCILLQISLESDNLLPTTKNVNLVVNVYCEHCKEHIFRNIDQSCVIALTQT